MTARLKPFLSFETTWIQEFARSYVGDDTSFSFPPRKLRRAKATLLDVRNVFRAGGVVFADKLDGPGALWIVEGEGCDGKFLRLTIVVVSANVDVELIDIER